MLNTKPIKKKIEFNSDKITLIENTKQEKIEDSIKESNNKPLIEYFLIMTSD
jgi:hypothetical protein